MKRRYLATVCAMAAGSLMAGCSVEGAAQLGAETPCRDFLQAPFEDQDAAIARVSDELGTQNALTPLGRPNIDYLCSRDQNRTLREVVESTG